MPHIDTGILRIAQHLKTANPLLTRQQAIAKAEDLDASLEAIGLDDCRREIQRLTGCGAMTAHIAAVRLGAVQGIPANLGDCSISDVAEEN